MHALSRRSWWTALAATALLTLGCGDPEAAPQGGTYVARVGETLLAIVVSEVDELAVAYACDGRDGVAPAVYAWFGGTLAAGTTELTGKWGTLTLDFAGDGATGELRLTGAAPQAYDAARSTTGALLWGSSPPEQADLLAGWIFADDGTQRGAVLKRQTGDVAAFSLQSQATTSATFEGTTLTVKTMTAPVLVQ